MANIGICLVSPAPQIGHRFCLELAKKVEEAGLHSFWVNDRLNYDNLEPLSVVAAAAAVSGTIKIGTSILLANLGILFCWQKL